MLQHFSTWEITRNFAEKQEVMNDLEKILALPNECWKPVEGYENYQVSTNGNVKSLNYHRTGKEKKMKPKKNKRGYLVISLSKNNKRKWYTIHRLVANAWLKPNDDPEHKTHINHRNETKDSNHYSNLEWCNVKYNANWGTRNERISKTMTNGSLSKTVYQYTLDGEFIKEWPSAHEVERQTGFSRSNISTCCQGKSKTVYGYAWSYVPLGKQSCQKKVAVKYNTKNSKVVYQYSLDGELVNEWPSVAEIGRQLGYASSNIVNCCNGKNKTAHGFIWRYEKTPEQ